MNAEYVERQLDKASLTAREKCLLDLSFGGEMTDEAFHTVTDGLDLDTENQNYLLMLSALGFAKGWGLFPPEMVPRLKGLHRYHQAHISMGIPWLVGQICALTDEGIPVMLLKGIAMRAYYAPGRPRLMWDYDIAVPREKFDRALELLLANGNALGLRTPHSAAVKGSRDEIDLHRWIFKGFSGQTRGIWARAKPFRFYGADVFVPEAEDMFFHLLDTQAHNFIRQESLERRMQWLCDCRCVWEAAGGLELNILARRAGEIHAESRVRMTLCLFMQCFPGLIDQEEFDRFFPETEEYRKMLKNMLDNGEKFKKTVDRYRSYGYTEQSAMTPIHIWRGLRFDILQYRYLKPELQWTDSKMSFFRFMRIAHSVGSFSDLRKDYLSRIHLFAKREGED